MSAVVLDKNGQEIENAWELVGEDIASLHDLQFPLVPFNRTQDFQPQIKELSKNYGLFIDVGREIEPFADIIADASLIVIDFPAFSDGRGFSLARIIREDIGYQGPLRAYGNYILDQIAFLIRCGFDEFQTDNKHVSKAMQAHWRDAVSLSMQPAFGDERKVDGRSLIRELD